MMSLTHGAIALSGAAFFLGDTSPVVLGLTLLGSQIPDMDTTTSIPGRMVYPVAKWIEERYAHRTITHCIRTSLAIAVLSLPLGYYLGWSYGFALPLGHILASFADCFTKEGVALFYPNPKRCVCGLNPRHRLATGSTVEYWLLAFFIGSLVILLNIKSAGGFMLQVEKVMGLESGVESVLNKYGGTHHIYVEIDGVKANDRTPINDSYFLVAQSANRFIVQDRNGELYETNTHLIAKRMNPRQGENSITKNQALYLDDEDLIFALKQVYEANPDSAIYLSGTITVDAPEEVRTPKIPGTYDAIAVSGNSVTLSFYPLEKAGQALWGQYAMGQLTAKIIYPAPQF
jgi:inner membrane protein